MVMAQIPNYLNRSLILVDPKPFHLCLLGGYVVLILLLQHI